MGAESPAVAQVIIVGPRRLQNQLMAEFLAAGAGVATRVLDDMDQLGGPHDAPPGATLVLKDAPSPQRDRLLEVLPQAAARLHPSHTLALFNIAPGLAIERDAFPLGVRGFLYCDDCPQILLRGVRALLEGEVWMSRRAMTQCLLTPSPPGSPPTGRLPSPLTDREAEILHRIALGDSNEQISDKLCISVNTVKTHVYRIFRKIEVDNRLQAALWAAKNL